MSRMSPDCRNFVRAPQRFPRSRFGRFDCRKPEGGVFSVAGELTHFLSLNDDDLRGLAGALRSGRLNPPFRSIALQRFVSSATSEGLAAELQSVYEDGLNVSQIAVVID